VAYLHARQFAPAIEALKPLRQQLGLRTALNTVEKLLDAGRAAAHLVGAFHGPALERVGRVLAHLGHARGAVVQGTEGSCDLSPSRRTRLVRILCGRVEAVEVAPETFGMPPAPDPAMPPGGAGECAALVEATLAGAATPLRDPALLTAAAWLWMAGRVETPGDGLALARTALATGRAHDCLRTAAGDRRAACSV
jgi:anthranilate phosphoribosyltransferase